MKNGMVLAVAVLMGAIVAVGWAEQPKEETKPPRITHTSKLVAGPYAAVKFHEGGQVTMRRAEVLPEFYPTCTQGGCAMQLALLCQQSYWPTTGPNDCNEATVVGPWMWEQQAGYCACTCWDGTYAASPCDNTYGASF